MTAELALDYPLVLVRAVHFASTVLVSGLVFLAAFVGRPTLGLEGGHRIAAELSVRFKWLGWLAIICALASGGLWLLFVAAQMADAPFATMWRDETVWIVVSQTSFGHAWVARLAILAFLAGYFLLADFLDPKSMPTFTGIAVLASAALVGALAWAGHGAVGEGYAGAIHRLADVVHLIAAAGWIGALLPLALLFAATADAGDDRSVSIAGAAARRFSILGTATVSALLATGIVNSWVLVGSVSAFVDTNYGRLLLIKIALFFSMLAIAGINRFFLTPRIVQAQGAAPAALRQLCRNSLIELGMGATILALVAVLGIIPPSSGQ